ncbi:hypothetical protein Bca52824_046211 [Brassica carinata]|uniref:RRM domain-containing protein n=1 Tax=Brassica carinata TaxID=52824 RepID=A0A8X7UPZ7_BRACI|nr:hypothetical protein Bca52824_046211 [Brassica carinata]
MAKDREDRKKEKREKKEKKEKKERKRREAEELAVREKKISKKHKSKSKAAEKPEKKPKKKSKNLKSSKRNHPRSRRNTRNQLNPNPKTKTNQRLPQAPPRNLHQGRARQPHSQNRRKGSRLISAVLESAELDSSKRNIFVRGLGWDTTHETLKAAFEVYGEIEECSVVMDKDTGRAKGYGFVMFKTRKGCREALRNPEKRMFNRTVSCNLAAAKPAGAGKPREPVESVKIDLTQSEVVLPGLRRGHKQQQNVPPLYGGQNMPFYGHGHPPPGFNPMYFMGNQMGPGVPNFPMFGPGMMNHMGMAGQYGGEGNGVGPGFDGERAWYLR